MATLSDRLLAQQLVFGDKRKKFKPNLDLALEDPEAFFKSVNPNLTRTLQRQTEPLTQDELLTFSDAPLPKKEPAEKQADFDLKLEKAIAAKKLPRGTRKPTAAQDKKKIADEARNAKLVEAAAKRQAADLKASNTKANKVALAKTTADAKLIDAQNKAEELRLKREEAARQAAIFKQPAPLAKSPAKLVLAPPAAAVASPSKHKKSASIGSNVKKGQGVMAGCSECSNGVFGRGVRAGVKLGGVLAKGVMLGGVKLGGVSARGVVAKGVCAKGICCKGLSQGLAQGEELTLKLSKEGEGVMAGVMAGVKAGKVKKERKPKDASKVKKEPSAWVKFVQAYKKSHPELKYSEAMKAASGEWAKLKK